ncbi:unnamed protein product, partial [Protopolystoma xenopodis]
QDWPSSQDVWRPVSESGPTDTGPWACEWAVIGARVHTTTSASESLNRHTRRARVCRCRMLLCLFTLSSTLSPLGLMFSHGITHFFLASPSFREIRTSTRPVGMATCFTDPFVISSPVLVRGRLKSAVGRPLFHRLASLQPITGVVQASISRIRPTRQTDRR